MDSTFKFYADILDKMIDEKNFWRYYFLGPYCLDYGVKIDDATYLTCGATRGCLISDDCDEVVKFAFEDGNECEKEADTYNAAVEVGLGNCFVPCRRIGTYSREVKVLTTWDEAAEKVNYSDDPDDWDVLEEDEAYMTTRKIYVRLYAYTRIDGDYGDFEAAEPSPEERTFCKNNKSPLTERSFKVGIEFLREYGTETFYDLSNFCLEWQVNDLHSGNVGYLHGHVVLMDYAGYWR